jgi:hypothetical protein
MLGRVIIHWLHLLFTTRMHGFLNDYKSFLKNLQLRTLDNDCFSVLQIGPMDSNVQFFSKRIVMYKAEYIVRYENIGYF